MNVYTILANGFEEIEALAVVDILRRAEIFVTTFSMNDSRVVSGAHNITILADALLKDIDNSFDMIFLPGGYPGYVNLENSHYLADVLRDADERKKYIAAICAAPSVIGKMGMLRGKKACCFPSFEEFLEGADVSYDDVCVSENIITSRGAGTAHLLAFKIVELCKGKEVSDKLREAMLYK